MKKILLIVLLCFGWLVPIQAEEPQPQDTYEELASVEDFRILLTAQIAPMGTLTKIERVGKLDNGAYITMMAMDGTLVYCLDPTILADLGDGFTIDYDAFSWETKDLIWKYTYYGYGYNQHQDTRWYAATQMCIWHLLGFYVDAYTMDGGLWDLSWEMSEIRELALSSGQIPSFHGQTFELNFQEPFTITDTQSALNRYAISSGSGVELIKSGNTLTMTIQDINYQREFSFSYGGYNSCLVYVKPGSQSVISVSRNEPGASFNFRIKLLTGDLIVHKWDEFSNKAPAGQQFQLFYDTLMQQPVLIGGKSVFETNKEGMLKILETLPPGNYILKESKSTQQFVENPTEYPITIEAKKTTEQEVINYYRNVELIIQKWDEEEPELALNGAEFEIIDITDLHSEQISSIHYEISKGSLISLDEYFVADWYLSHHERLELQEDHSLLAVSLGPATLEIGTSEKSELIQFIVVDETFEGLRKVETSGENDPYFPSLNLPTVQFRGITGKQYLQITDFFSNNRPLAQIDVALWEDSEGLTPIYQGITDELGMIDLDSLSLSPNEYFFKNEYSLVAQPFTVFESQEGKLTVPNLKWGRTYSVCEVKAPTGYDLSDDPCQTVTMNLDEGMTSVTLDFYNRKRRIDLHFFKCDTDNFTTKLDDAVFQFIKTPKQRNLEQEITLGFTGRLYWHVSDETGVPLTGVQFHISKDEHFTDYFSVFSDLEGDVILQVEAGLYYVKDTRDDSVRRYFINQGEIFFEDLIYGDTLQVCEVTAPSGYVLAEQCRTITIEADEGMEEIEFNFDNKRIPTYEDSVPKMGM